MSGLPIKNSNWHAGEIASMSLELLNVVKQHSIAHRPNDTLKLRIGIHTGTENLFNFFFYMNFFMTVFVKQFSNEKLNL